MAGAKARDLIYEAISMVDVIPEGWPYYILINLLSIGLMNGSFTK